MKEIIILCSMLFLFTMQPFAQTFAFLQHGKQLENNAEISVTKAVPSGADIEDELVLESELALKNLTDNDLHACMTQTVLTGITFPAGIISFCFYECILVNTSSVNTYRETCTNPNEVGGIIRANAIWENPRFHLSFYVSENLYTNTRIKYEIYPLDNPNDKTTVTIAYTYDENSTALSDINLQNKITASQEGNKVMFDYSLDYSNALIEVYNTTGNKMAQHRLNPDKGTFILPERLPEGLYIYTVKRGNKVTVTNKFIIK
jgi:hypothetical protein